MLRLVIPIERGKQSAVDDVHLEDVAFFERWDSLDDGFIVIFRVEPHSFCFPGIKLKDGDKLMLEGFSI